MFLKELEIYGFKSFGKKINLSFNSGVTAIVGPNGCGKSNITDAVRWVLGEQNIRSLRGKQLTDIIFSGNHSEKPLNIAEVSLTLDNSEKVLPVDWEEINIKRRIYRSGETENMINGIPCKLKDIQELFMNTGLSRNAYSIVAQGEIDLILNAKPSERRYLFEEAASISKYKYEKQKTLKRIEVIDNNLDKIENIISEIKNQLLILEEEAEHLKNYKVCQEKIKNLELFLIYQKYNLYRTNLSRIKKNLEHYEKEKDEIIKNIEKDESKINFLSIELNNLKEEQEKYKYENYELDNRKKIIQSELNLRLQKKTDVEKRLIDLKKEVESFSQKIGVCEQNIEAVNLDILGVNTKLDSSNQKIIDLDREFENMSKFTDSLCILESNSNKLLKKISEKELFSKEIKIKYKTTLDIININLEKIRKKRILLENQLKNMVIKESNYRKILKEDRKNEDEARFKLNEEKIKESESVLKRLQAEVEKDKHTINLREERINILKKTIDINGKKNGQNTKAFYSKYYQKYPDDICEKLIELIDSIPKKYEKVIEIALKESLNSIVVNNISSALDIINSLSENELDEIKLLPLDLIEKIKTLPDDQVKFQNKNIYGLASSLINYSQKYQNLFKALLGNILIVGDIKTALDVSNKYLGKYKIVSLEGMVINIDGSVDVYSNSKNYQEGFYYIEKEIKETDKEIEDLKLKIAKNDNSIEKYNNIYNSLWEENKKIKRLLQENEKNVIINMDNLNRITISTNELKENLKDILIEENSILEEKENISKKYSIFEKNHNIFSEYSKNINQAVKTINQIVARGNGRINNLSKEKNNLKNAILLNKEKLISLKEKVENIYQYKNEHLTDLKEKKDIVKEYSEKLNNLLMEIEEYNVQISRLDINDPTVFKKAEEIKEILQKKSILLENIQKAKINRQKRYESIKERQHKEEILEVQYQEKYDNVEYEINKNYNLSVEKLELYKNISGSQKEANQKIEILREDILKMGQINFEAENRYRSQLQRYDSLRGKYNEMCQAKESLEVIISEIDQIATERFKKTFNQVKIYFNDIFKKIFSGGEGKLIINYDKDILNSRIEIIAQPPGKKTQNIELLSSGEKALTAIALLLALWKANPSPFCLFDEIDTSLDDTNTGKLVNILRGEDLNHSQLIIITHQKTTMEAADTLYGITMEETGISKLVSVKLEK
ncbi:MAG: chromosome segregation protein SMC [Candidatus Caldatribacteriota bacterium]|nr:chromosome segregation protein SMC [Candidatus Caldatribacteriota bacterium]